MFLCSVTRKVIQFTLATWSAVVILVGFAVMTAGKSCHRDRGFSPQARGEPIGDYLQGEYHGLQGDP